MGFIKDSLERLNIEVTSPDGTVRGSMTSQDGISVSVDRRALSDHTDDSLEHQINRVLSGLSKGYARAASAIREQSDALRGLNPTPDWPAEKRRIELKEILDEEIEATGQGPEKYATVVCRGTSNMELSLRPGATRFLRWDTLDKEVNEAIRVASENQQMQVFEIYRDLYLTRNPDEGERHGS